MSRRPAKITQADVARTIRAAKQAGAAGVEVRPDGTIFVKLMDEGTSAGAVSRLDPDPEIVL